MCLSSSLTAIPCQFKGPRKLFIKFPNSVKPDQMCKQRVLCCFCLYLCIFSNIKSLKTWDISTSSQYSHYCGPCTLQLKRTLNIYHSLGSETTFVAGWINNSYTTLALPCISWPWIPVGRFRHDLTLKADLKPV